MTYPYLLYVFFCIIYRTFTYFFISNVWNDKNDNIYQLYIRSLGTYKGHILPMILKKEKIPLVLSFLILPYFGDMKKTEFLAIADQHITPINTKKRRGWSRNFTANDFPSSFLYITVFDMTHSCLNILLFNTGLYLIAKCRSHHCNLNSFAQFNQC